jgi:TnpA family transposase
LQRATARLVNFHLRQPLAQAWGQVLTSRSEAQIYAVPARVLNATVHPKYFASAERGIAVYTHVPDCRLQHFVMQMGETEAYGEDLAGNRARIAQADTPASVAGQASVRS